MFDWLKTAWVWGVGALSPVRRSDRLERNVGEHKAGAAFRASDGPRKPIDLKLTHGVWWGRIVAGETKNAYCPNCAADELWITMIHTMGNSGKIDFRCLECRCRIALTVEFTEHGFRS